MVVYESKSIAYNSGFQMRLSAIVNSLQKYYDEATTNCPLDREDFEYFLGLSNAFDFMKAILDDNDFLTDNYNKVGRLHKSAYFRDYEEILEYKLNSLK